MEGSEPVPVPTHATCCWCLCCLFGNGGNFETKLCHDHFYFICLKCLCVCACGTPAPPNIIFYGIMVQTSLEQALSRASHGEEATLPFCLGSASTDIYKAVGRHPLLSKHLSEHAHTFCLPGEPFGFSPVDTQTHAHTHTHTHMLGQKVSSRTQKTTSLGGAFLSFGFQPQKVQIKLGSACGTGTPGCIPSPRTLKGWPNPTRLFGRFLRQPKGTPPL